MDVFPAKDITVWTPAEIQECSAEPNAFITTALSEGKVLYEKQHSGVGDFDHARAGRGGEVGEGRPNDGLNHLIRGLLGGG